LSCHSSVSLLDLPSFPTRRSSDLGGLRPLPASARRRPDGRALPAGAWSGRRWPFVSGEIELDLGAVRIVQEHLPDTGSCLLAARSEEHTSELQSLAYLVCRLLLEK